MLFGLAGRCLPVERSPAQGGPGNIETTGVGERCPFILLWDQGYITIARDKHLDGASWSWNGAKGQSFPKGEKKEALEIFEMSPAFELISDIQNAREAVRSKAASGVKGAMMPVYRLDIRDEYVDVKKSRCGKQETSDDLLRVIPL